MLFVAANYIAMGHEPISSEVSPTGMFLCLNLDFFSCCLALLATTGFLSLI